MQVNVYYKKHQGFHLIEILIVIAIVVVCAGIGLPMMSQYFVKEKRLEASAALTKLSLAMEDYHTKYNTYRDATLTALNFPQLIVKNNYRLFIEAASEDNYILIAKPLAKQAERDTACGDLSLTASGDKGISGPAKVNECWG